MRDGMGAWTRRDLLKLSAFALATPVLAQVRGGQRGQAAQSGTQLVLLGTQGGPGVAANRNQASNAVIVDGRPYRNKRDLVTKKLLTPEQYDKLKDQVVARQPKKGD